jgi:alkanesulfonate monooxygenase SsuD/methylene tetrahydromethanopterin reductase-like flavin-dependent oxidoreductase (luciferase family)
MTMRALAETTGEVTGGRFVLGIGVSHSHLVTNVRGPEYGKPVSTMRAYLEAMGQALYRGPRPPSPARANMQIYTGLPNYQNNLKWLGFGDTDFAGGGSDRLVDAIVAWGDEDAIRRRVRAHFEAGADHVCVQPLHPDGKPVPHREVLELLAPAQGGGW